MKRRIAILSAAALMASACTDDGVTTAEVQDAAKERVRHELGLTPESALFTETHVGQPLNGDTTLCGIVEGRRADGTAITPRRFIVATDPGRWVKFEPVTAADIPASTDKFVEWGPTCAGARDLP